MRWLFDRLFFNALFCVASVQAFDVSYKIETAAGSDWTGDGAAATRAVLVQAEGIAADSSGNLYVADAAGHRIRKVTPGGIIRTIAGTGTPGFSGDGGPATSAQLNTPYGLAFDPRGNLYIADLGNARVRQVSMDGTITTIAGGGSLTAGAENEGSRATSVILTAPRNLALDGRGNIYISDFGAHRVYRLSADGSLTTTAGTGVPGFSGDTSAATRAQLSFPTAIAIDRQGALYIADSQNHLIRKVAGGVIFSIARAATPTGMAVDGFGTVYVADRTAGQILSLPVTGPATALNAPARDLAFLNGYLYAADGAVVRRVSFSGPSTIVAGGGSMAFGDLGNAQLARLNHPSGVAADSAGNFYIADRDNHRIRRVAPDGTITTIAGTGDAGDSGDGGLATKALLNSPSAVSIDAAGALYIADTGNHRVRRVTPSGLIFPVVNTPSPAYVFVDTSGNILVADDSNGTIRKVNGTGGLVGILDGLQSPRGLAIDAAGNLYFTEAGAKRVSRMSSTGKITSFGEGLWSVPRGVAVTAAGDVFVADTGLQRILHIDTAGQVTPVAGTGSAGFAGDGDAALSAQLGFPWDVAIGPAGMLYIADLDNNRVRRLIPGPGIVIDPIRLVEALNAASLQPGPLVPGMLLALRGTGFAPADLADVQILFDKLAAPILGIDNTRLLVQVPLEIATRASVQIDVQYQGASRALISASIAEAAPAVFADASGQAAAANEDGSLNSTANPAPRGSVVTLYGTGEGVSGLPISVRLGDYLAEVLYAGPVDGYPGLLQVNARVPAGYIVPGNMSVIITVGQAFSQAGVTIAVK